MLFDCRVVAGRDAKLCTAGGKILSCFLDFGVMANALFPRPTNTWARQGALVLGRQGFVVAYDISYGDLMGTCVELCVVAVTAQRAMCRLAVIYCSHDSVQACHAGVAGLLLVCGGVIMCETANLQAALLFKVQPWLLVVLIEFPEPGQFC